MNKWWTLGIFGAVAIVGAILAFAVDDGHLRATPLGLILLATGALLVLGWCADRWFSPIRPAASNSSGSGSNPPGEQGAADSPLSARRGTAAGSPATGFERIRIIGGLIVVLAAIGAIVSLFVVTITLKSDFTADSAIAFATSAFGVISALTGAYLGIKITSDNSRDQAAATQNVADATQKVVLAGQQVADSSEKVAVAAAKITNGD